MRQPSSSTSLQKVKACVFNVQRVKNKALSLNDYILDEKLDLAVLIETWLRPGDLDNVVIAELCPPGYAFRHLPRKNGSGYGGVGLVYRENISVKLKKVKLSHLVSFENMVVTLTSGCVTVNMAIIYRTPPS